MSAGLLPLMSAIIDIFGVAAVLSIIADADASLVRCLLSEIDAPGETDALEILKLLLLSADETAADVELGQRPHIGDGIGKGGNTCAIKHM
jgi:hypothetical protein